MSNSHNKRDSLSRTLPTGDAGYRPKQLIEHRIQLKDRSQHAPSWQVSRQFAAYIDQSMEEQLEVKGSNGKLKKSIPRL